jgi:hypothetical protein
MSRSETGCYNEQVREGVATMGRSEKGLLQWAGQRRGCYNEQVREGVATMDRSETSCHNEQYRQLLVISSANGY